MIEKCTKTAKQFYDEIGYKKEIVHGRDSSVDFHKSDDDDDNSTYNSEETPVNGVAI